MKLKLTFLYVLSFLALTFFIHEIHDWAHTLVARLFSGCWGPRTFDSWGLCPTASVSYGPRILVLMAGILINFILLWVGWQKMEDPENLAEQSLGCSLVFAALPFNMLLEAASGKGDLADALRLFFRHADHRILSLVGLLIVVMVCIPPLIRAFLVLPWWLGRIFFYPVFLIVPGYLDHWLVGKMLNKWLISGLPEDKAYLWVAGWTIFVMVIWLLTRQKMKQLISDEELPL